MIRRSLLPRSTKPIARNVRPKARRSKPRRGPMRNPDYLAFLRERRCVVCLIEQNGYGITKGDEAWCGRFGCGRVEAAHGPVNGMRSKGPDDGALPLGARHHREQHAIGWPAFEAKYGFSREKEAVAHRALYLIDRENGLDVP